MFALIGLGGRRAVCGLVGYRPARALLALLGLIIVVGCTFLSLRPGCGYRPPNPAQGSSERRRLVEILGQVAPLHPPNDTFPGEIFLRLGADALDWAGSTGPIGQGSGAFPDRLI
jgi:hypothetical protein